MTVHEEQNLEATPAASCAPIRYSRGVGQFDNRPEQFSAPDFQSFLIAVRDDRAHFKGEQWISGPMAIAADDPLHRRTESFSRAIGRPHRCKVCAQPRRFVGLDIDRGLTAEIVETLVGMLQKISGFVYTTASSTPDVPRIRVVLELDKEADREDLQRATGAVRAGINKAMRHAGYADLAWDVACDKPEQPLYLPLEGADFYVLGSRPLPLDTLLEDAARTERALQMAAHIAGPAIAMDSSAMETLDRALEEVGAAPKGQRNEVLNTKAYHLGGIVAAGRLSRAHVESSLQQVTQLNNWEDPSKVAATIRDGVSAGMLQPIHSPQMALQVLRPYRNRVQLSHISEILAANAAPDWLVRSRLELNTLACLFGVSGCGKSFIAIDLAMCVATGVDYYGSPVRQGPVLYLAGEGQRGIARRVRAWGIQHEIDVAQAPLIISKAGVPLTEANMAQVLLEELERFTAEFGPPVLIIIDTMARSFGTGDENNTKDMSAFVNACDELRLATEACVTVVHHTSKKNPDAARGNGALRGAMDWEYSAFEDSGLIHLACTKSKDFEQPRPLAFRIQGGVDLGEVDDLGEPVTSAVLAPAYSMALSKGGMRSQGKHQTAASRVLSEMLEEAEAGCPEGETPSVPKKAWQARCDTQEKIDSKRFGEVVKSLRKNRVIKVTRRENKEWVQFADEGDLLE